MIWTTLNGTATVPKWRNRHCSSRYRQMTRSLPSLHIGILAYPGAQAAAVHGLVDLFGVANRLKGGPGPELEVQVLQAESLPGQDVSWTALILPPSLGGGDPRES